MLPENDKLEKALESARREIKTDSYSMSIGEALNMYENNELILNPSYQRFFVWDIEQKSKFIESVFVGLPLPMFFVSQLEDGKWDVVDGLQRLSTIFEYMGKLREENKNKSKDFKKMTGDMVYLKDFENKSWNDLSSRIQLDFKRSRIQLSIILRQDEDVKFEMFQRLNSGGTNITGQQIRDAILAGNCPKMHEWIEKLSKHENFRKLIGIHEKNEDKCKESGFDKEAVLRFLVFRSDYAREIGKSRTLDSYLRNALMGLVGQWGNGSFDKELNEEIFRNTFDVIMESGGVDTFKGNYGFSYARFEAIALGIAQNLENTPPPSAIKQKILEIDKQDAFIKNSGAGKNTAFRIKKLLEFGKNYFSKNQ
jgi:hypothetical protein